MRHIPPNDATFRSRGRGDSQVIKQLAAVIVHSREHEQRNRVAFALDEAFDIFGADRGLSRAGAKLNERASGIVAVKLKLGFDRVLIGWKRV